MTQYKDIQHTGVMGMKWGHHKIQKIDKRISTIKKDTKEDIDSFKPYMKTGITTKKGKPVLTAKDVNDIVNGSRDVANKQISKLQNKKTKIQGKLDTQKAKDKETAKSVKAYTKEFNKAERMSNKSDKQWADVKQQYHDLGKNRVQRFMAVAKGNDPKVKKYLSDWEKAERAGNAADAQWKNSAAAYKQTGRNRVDRVLNNIKYDKA